MRVVRSLTELHAGYTGKYTAEFITTNLPTDLKWAIAGRSRGKLEKLAADMKPLNPDRQQPGRYLFGNRPCPGFVYCLSWLPNSQCTSQLQVN